jgi:hypothetical protein
MMAKSYGIGWFLLFDESIDDGTNRTRASLIQLVGKEVGLGCVVQ